MFSPDGTLISASAAPHCRAQLKNVKEFEKESNRGDVRWVREGDSLSMQWRDHKTVLMGSGLFIEDPKSMDRTEN